MRGRSCAATHRVVGGETVGARCNAQAKRGRRGGTAWQKGAADHVQRRRLRSFRGPPRALLGPARPHLRRFSMPRASSSAPPPDSLRVHDRVECKWSDGSVHTAEIVGDRVKRGAGAGGGAGSAADADKEFYVHYVACAWAGLPAARHRCCATFCCPDIA